MMSPFASSLLEGKTALVTGAGKGIGRACSLSLAAAGAKVIAVARTSSDLTDLANAFPDNIAAWEMDATSADFFQMIEERTDITILVNNVGANKPEPIEDVTSETLDWLMSLNIKTTYLASQAVVKGLKKYNRKGSIINITSQMGHIGSPNRTVYCMTKHAVEGLTKALAVECAPDGIRVNSVAPTFIKTPMTEPMLADPDFKSFVMDKIPMGQIGEPDDVANAVVYLASDLSKLVTGTSLKVDGGWTAE